MHSLLFFVSKMKKHWKFHHMTKELTHGPCLSFWSRTFQPYWRLPSKIHHRIVFCCRISSFDHCPVCKAPSWFEKQMLYDERWEIHKKVSPNDRICFFFSPVLITKIHPLKLFKHGFYKNQSLQKKNQQKSADHGLFYILFLLSKTIKHSFVEQLKIWPSKIHGFLSWQILI